MAEPISVAVRRGGTVESIHRVHAVAVNDGEIVGDAGDPELVTFMRSAAKPIQVLPLARERDDLDDRELAIASASHMADEDQLAAVRSLLAKAPATEDDLECGPDGDPPRRINHNCSGKHAGMLALCHAKGWPYEGYRLADHPCQQVMLAEVTSLAGAGEIPTAVDGCGVVTFALPLRSGWIAKGGAEGLLCATASDGLGLALKVEDGSHRALRPALGAFLAQLGLGGSEFGPVSIRNSRNEVVGELAAC